MTLVLPTIPVMPAGYIAQAADMNNLAYAAQFLLIRPLAKIYDSSGTATIPTSATAVTFNNVWFDSDSMWNSGTPTRLTVQTPGFYQVRYLVNGWVSSGTLISFNSWISVTTGSNNPGGAGVSTTCWEGGGAGGAGTGNRICARSAGVVPWYMYIGDHVTIMTQAAATGLTLTTNRFNSYLALELVSI